MPKLKTGTVALCDIVYKDEMTNKPILAGVMGGGLLIESFPFDLRLGLYLEIYPQDLHSHEYDLQVFVGKNHIGGSKMAAASQNVQDPLGLIIPQFPAPVTEPTTLEIRLSVDGLPAQRLLRRTVGLKTDPSA
jgi:hypothetical protein